MAGTAVPGRLSWRLARLARTFPETARVDTLEFDIPGWPGHLAGQHIDIRLTAEDGYQAERSYSIASAAGDVPVALTVERLDDGEVSPYLTLDLQPGDQIEVRGPIGGYFTWRPQMTDPIVLIGGGSGIVPLMSILRTRATVADPRPATLLGSFRTWGDIIYREEIARLAQADPGLRVSWTLTRTQPDGWTGYARRIDAAMLTEIAGLPEIMPAVYICGPTPFVERAAALLVDAGHEAARIRTERFGPSGG
jgi:ferredoxin-NADP reductase